MKRIQNEHIICAGFGFCALNSAVARNSFETQYAFGLYVIRLFS